MEFLKFYNMKTNKNYWTANLDCPIGFDLHIENITVSYNNIRQVIFDIDEVFINSGEKYGLFYLFPDELKNGDRDSLKNQYFINRKNFIQETKKSEDEYFSIGQFNCSQFINLSNLNDYPKMKLLRYSEENRREIEELFIEIPKFNPYFDYDSDIIKIKKGEVKNIEFSISSNCNIWYEEIENDVFDVKNITESYYGLIDNRFLAYKNTPRLNSFLKELLEVCKKYGGNINLEENRVKYKHFFTEKGILLGDEIIYEDRVNI